MRESYAKLLAALSEGTFAALESVPLGGVLKLSNPLAENAFDLEGLGATMHTKCFLSAAKSKLAVSVCLFCVAGLARALAAPCATLTAQMEADHPVIGSPVFVILTMTSRLPEMVIIYEDMPAWDYNWEVQDQGGRPLKLKKLGEHYSEKLHMSTGRAPTKYAPGASVTDRLELAGLVEFPKPGEYQAEFNRTFKTPWGTCTATAETLHFSVGAAGQ